MRRLGLDVGLAVNPETPFEVVEPHLGDIDLLLIMTVHPGFGGQEFMADVMPKVSRARAEADRRGLKLAIEVDGGIDVDTAPLAAAAGADTFVVGSAIFHADDPLAAAQRLRAALG
jgi:ribulose-phosphate 3-epimerase